MDTLETLEPIMREHPFLAGLSEQHLRFMAGCAANERFDRGKFLFREGTEADKMYLLRTGRVTLEVFVPGKGEVQVESLDAGDVLGWSCLFPPYRWHLDARVVEPALVLAFDGQCLRPKMEEDKALGYEITRRLLNKVHERLDNVRMQRLDPYKA